MTKRHTKVYSFFQLGIFKSLRHGTQILPTDPNQYVSGDHQREGETKLCKNDCCLYVMYVYIINYLTDTFYKSTTSLLFIAYAKQADAKSINCELTFLFD